MAKKTFRWSMIFRQRCTYAYTGGVFLLLVLLIFYQWKRMGASNTPGCDCLGLTEWRQHPGQSPVDDVIVSDTIFTEADFPAGADRSRHCYYHCKFKSIKFDNINLSACRIDSCTFEHCKFIDCNFSKTDFDSTVCMQECTWRQCNFYFTVLEQRLTGAATFTDCNFNNCDFFPLGLDSIDLDWTDNDNLFYLSPHLVADTPRLNIIRNALTRSRTGKGDLKYLDAAAKADTLSDARLSDWIKGQFGKANWLNDYRTNYLKPLIFILAITLVFFLIYLRLSFGKEIYISWSPSLKSSNGKKDDKRIKPFNRIVGSNYCRRAWGIFYFTLVSTLSFGYLVKQIDLDSLIAKFQKRKYSYELEGKVKIYSAIQSLIFAACLLAEIEVWK